MVYTKKEKAEIERVREVFAEHIRQSPNYELLLLNGRSRGNLPYPTTMWQLIPPMEPAVPMLIRF